LLQVGNGTISYASKFLLTLWGAIIQVNRGSYSDNDFRERIRLKLLAISSNGNPDRIISLLWNPGNETYLEPVAGVDKDVKYFEMPDSEALFYICFNWFLSGTNFYIVKNAVSGGITGLFVRYFEDEADVRSELEVSSAEEETDTVYEAQPFPGLSLTELDVPSAEDETDTVYEALAIANESYI